MLNLHRSCFKMAKVSKSYLIKNLKLLHYHNKADSDQEFLAKITQLKLNDKYINKVDLIEGCPNVTTIYLQSNLLRSIENFEFFPSLTHLYLQRNKIAKIENLQKLVCLRKIYLGYNEICVLEGFESTPSIKEIHIEHQQLPLGESLYFDPRTMANISRSLEVLNIAGNGLFSIFSTGNLIFLRELLAEENKLSDLGQLLVVLESLPALERLNLANNPVSCRRDFTDQVIVSTKALINLNGKEVNSSTREFIAGLMRARQVRQKRLNCNDGGGDADLCLLPHSTGPFQYPPWQLRTAINESGKKFVPRPFRTRKSTTEKDEIVDQLKIQNKNL